MSDSAYQPCHMEGKRLKLCSSLQKAVQVDKRHTSLGVHLLTFTNDITGEVTREFVTINSGGFRPNGVVMNVCPFCAQPLQEDLPDRDMTSEEDSE